MFTVKRKVRVLEIVNASPLFSPPNWSHLGILFEGEGEAGDTFLFREE
jgi:hypothetical protein